MSLFLSSKITKPDAMRCHGTRDCKRMSLYQFILMFMSILQSSTELVLAGCIYMCIVVLCASLCVVFYIKGPPLIGQVLGKVLLTNWEIS